MSHKLLKPFKNIDIKHDRNSSLPGFNPYENMKLNKEKKLSYNKIQNYNPFQERKMLESKLMKKQLNKMNAKQFNNKIFSNSFISNNLNNFNITNSILNTKRNSSKTEKKRKNSFNSNNDSLIIIQKEVNTLWDDLCVLESYKELFNVVISQLELNEKIEFYQSEIDTLNLFRGILLKLKNSIKERNNCLFELKSLNKQLSEVLKNKSPESNEEIFEFISNEIQKLRKCTINIVNSFVNFRKEINQFSMDGKYNINRLEKRFCFDRNYLIKMKEELHFIKDGYIKFFFDVNDDNSPFLIKASENNANESFIRKVPITDDEREEIKKCQFLIYQDLIFYQNRNYFNGNIFRKISPIKKYPNELINKPNITKQMRLATNYFEKNLNNKKINNLNNNYNLDNNVININIDSDNKINNDIKLNNIILNKNFNNYQNLNNNLNNSNHDSDIKLDDNINNNINNDINSIKSKDIQEKEYNDSEIKLNDIIQNNSNNDSNINNNSNIINNNIEKNNINIENE